MSPEERRQVITLPSSVVKLTAVKHLVLYRSSRVQLAAETARIQRRKVLGGLVHECERAA